MSSITFAEFMRRALYDPSAGYYMTPREHFGHRGDFNTISHYSDLFGQIMAAEFAALHTELDSPASFTVVELGPGDGSFAFQVLTELRERFAELFAATRYLCVDISPALREIQRMRLREFADRVMWCEQIADIPNLVTGAFFSNEFFDALPVHVVRQRSTSLSEILVESREGKHHLREEELSENRLAAYWKRAGTSLEPGQLAEIGIEAIEVLRSISQKLERGRVITIDYGDTAERLYDCGHPEGTVRCFSNHQLSHDPLKMTGEQDITASVNFSALIEYGREFGLETVSFQRLTDYLVERRVLERSADLIKGSVGKGLAVKQLFVPHGIAGYFKVLVQARTRAATPD